MPIRIYDSYNKQMLSPMSIVFDSSGDIYRITACVEGKDPVGEGFWAFEGVDLEKIAITGELSMNEHLIPRKFKKQ